jgi:predicted dehydrogenase
MNGIDRLRIALVGLGERGQFHLETLLLREDCEVVLAVDPQAALRERWRGRIPRLETALEPENLSNERVHVVWLATPEEALPGLIDKAIRGRCALVLEPWFQSVDGQIERQLEWAESEGCRVVVHLPHREFPEFRRALQIRKSGRLGQLRHLSRCIWQLSPRLPGGSSWLALARQVGPWLDQALRLAGAEGRVVWSRHEGCLDEGGNGPDQPMERPGGVQILLEFGSELVGWLDLQWQAPAAWDSGWRLRGTEGVWQPTGGTLASPSGELLEFRSEEPGPDLDGAYDRIVQSLLRRGPNPGEWRDVAQLGRLLRQILKGEAPAT